MNHEAAFKRLYEQSPNKGVGITLVLPVNGPVGQNFQGFQRAVQKIVTDYHVYADIATGQHNPTGEKVVFLTFIGQPLKILKILQNLYGEQARHEYVHGRTAHRVLYDDIVKRTRAVNGITGEVLTGYDKEEVEQVRATAARRPQYLN